MKLAIVSPYPPSKGTLNEYAFHLVKQFQNKRQLEEIIILTDKIEETYPKEVNDGPVPVKIIPCWDFNAFSTAFMLVKVMKQHKVDCVLFNIQFLSFGDKKVPAAIGLLGPLWSRLNKIPAVTLLHNITETVDYKSAGITDSKVMQWIYSAIGTVLTRVVLCTNRLAVTLPKYVRILNKKYKVNNVRCIPHGTFEQPPVPDYSPKEKLQVMTFGKFGTYKKVEEMIEAVEIVRKRTGKEIEIVVAGTDNPNVKGYLDSVQKQYEHVPDMRFTGYVEEEDVPTIFGDSTVVVFPYTSTTGSSGVLHQAGSYGKAVVLPNIGDLKELIEEEGYRGAYFTPSDVNGLANAIEKLIVDDAYRTEMAQTNYAAAASLPMSEIADMYLEEFQKLCKVPISEKEIKQDVGLEELEVDQMFI